MSGNGNASAKMGERKMEGEASVRTLDCLRGRLLAERAASRNAKQEAEQLGNKLIELENMLKHEAKSRNRAEKKLKSLMKKLESIDIPCVSELMDKSDISSISSWSSSTPKFQQQNQESRENVIPHNNSDLSSLSDDAFIAEDISISAFEIELKRQEHENGASSPPLSEIFGRKTDEHSDKSSPKVDQQSDIWYDESVIRSCVEEDDRDHDSQIDDSMALVLVDTKQKNHAIDPEILDATVKEVLDALRYAKEQLQSSMERRRMDTIRVG